MLFSPVLAHAGILAFGDGLVETLPAFFAPNERWQPAMLAGFPIYADPNKVFWYPLRLLRFVPNGFNVYILAGYAVAAWATYGYVRSITGVVWAGIASAAAFSCGGFLISHFGHPMIVQPAAWACVAIWSLDSYLRFGRGRSLLALALAEVLCFASGQPQIAAFTIALLTGYLGWNGFGRSFQETARVYLEGSAAIALGVAAAGMIWIPAVVQGASSVRSGLDFPSFVLDSLPARHLARTLVYPFAAGGGAAAIYRGGIVPAEGVAFAETACYVALGALALAPLAPFAGRRRLAYFWIFTACLALALALGDALPLAAFTFKLPVYKLFRIPGRHAFEFTLSVAVLSGLGVAAIARGVRRRGVLYLGLFAVSTIAALATMDVASGDAAFGREPAVTIFLAALAIQLALLLAATAPRRAPLTRAATACGAVVAGSLAFAATAYWLDSSPASALATPGYVRLLERLPLGRGQRVYTQGDGAHEELRPNLPTMWGVPDIGGYTPLQLSPVRIFLQTGEDGRFLDVASPLVDLAAVRYFAVPAQAEGGVEASVRYAQGDLGDFLSVEYPNAPRSLTFGLAQPRGADGVGLVTALGASIDVPQGETVANVVLRGRSGAAQVLPLRAGVETAEFAYDRPDVLAAIRHRRAALYQRDGVNSWYECLLPVRLREPVASVDIRMIDSHAALNVRKLSLIDRSAGLAYPFSGEAPYFGDPRHFRHVADVDGVAVFENLRSGPAVWIASAVPSVLGTASDAEMAAFRERLRGMNLRRDALTAGTPATGPVRGSARLVRDEAERREAVATCPGECLLVSSMTFTDDWTAAVDGRPSRLVRADGFLQGVVVPPGRHVVELRYQPLAGRAGVALSGTSAAVLLGWTFLRWRSRRAGEGRSAERRVEAALRSSAKSPS
ncbi:MAG: hypothetical protein WAJ85_12775 [Candidatus Baltobacteraceae bacterium]